VGAYSLTKLQEHGTFLLNNIIKLTNYNELQQDWVDTMQNRLQRCRNKHMN